MFFKSDEVQYDKENMKNIDLSTTIPIQRLLGGTVYYPNYFEIISSEFFEQKGPSFDAKRAFYHKFTFEIERDEILDLIKKLNNTTDDNEKKTLIDSINQQMKQLREKSCTLLFFILYYGDVRPDRYDTKHIYDTTLSDDGDVKGTRYMTFDLLSIFNNALNPLHTMYRNNRELRNGVSVFNKFNNVFKNLSEWKLICTSGNEKFFPNSLLPFYSVDMMLLFLRKPYKDTEVLITSNESMTQTKNKYKKLNSLIAQVDDYVYKGHWLFDEVKNLINSTFGEEYKLQRDVIDQLRHNLKIIEKTQTLYNSLISQSSDSMLFMYKNNIINYIYEDYIGKDKDRDEMIKRINVFQTNSEIYNYLIDILWKKFIKEMVIRREIQEQIRKKETIKNYYDKLWNLTIEAFERIKIDDDQLRPKNKKSDIVGVYKAIYDKGVKVFIEG